VLRLEQKEIEMIKKSLEKIKANAKLPLMNWEFLKEHCIEKLSNLTFK